MKARQVREARRLVVNADDFGLSEAVNSAVIETHVRGIVTSASLMVRYPASASAIAAAREHPRLGIGLHIDLGEWRYQSGDWIPLYEVVPPGDRVALEAEVRAQLATFWRLAMRAPTHLDSHQHVHLRDEVRDVALALAHEIGVPLRHFTPGITYCGDFYGQDSQGATIAERVSAGSLVRILSDLPDGISELACHPGGPPDEDYGGTMYLSEREQEVVALCDPTVRTACDAMGIKLCSFAALQIKRDEPRRSAGRISEN